MIFGPEYAGIYDALYKTKDYVAETSFVLDRVRGSIPPGGSLIDFGCGTGLHAIEMARNGYSVIGVDHSPNMIALAQNRLATLPDAVAKRLQFEVGDMCEIDLRRTSDAVFSLFHVICYMTDDKMLQAALGTMRRHLQPGGTLLFDFWYADAVLNAPPERRERIIEIDGQQIKRIMTPRWEPERSLVHVTYDVQVMGETESKAVPNRETHSIRYFSLPELDKHLAQAGFSTVRFGEWLTDAAPSNEGFGVYCVARAE